MTGIAPRQQQARPLALALLVEARPKQWVKNVLVFVAPAAAGVLTEPDVAGRTLVAFAAFCAAASGTYYLNDAADVEADRKHPIKCARPIAAGEIPVPLARVVGVLLLVASLAIALVASWQTAAVVAAYVCLTSLYSTWLKHIAVVDLVAVAAGFLLRAAGGAAAADVPISSWFYIVASAASVFMVTGKRLAELRTGGENPERVRSILASYSTQYLQYVLSVSSGIAILAYCLWAFEEAALRTEGAAWLELSSIPFVLGLLRYALLIDAGGGGEPEDLVWHDRPLQVIGLAWALMFGIGVNVS